MAKSKTARTQERRAQNDVVNKVHSVDRSVDVTYDQDNQGDLLWEFTFEQITSLTNQLLEAKVLRLDQIMHVIQLFAKCSQTAADTRSLGGQNVGSTLLWCARDVIHDHCTDFLHPQE